MPYNHTATYSMSGSRPETASQTGPTQLDFANYGCGYDCGWGCKEPCEGVPYEAEPHGEDEDGGESDTDTISTLVPSDDEGAFTAEDQQRDVDDDEMNRQSEILDPENLEENNIQVVLRGWDDTSHHALPSEDFDDRSGSLDVEPCATDDHSTAPSSSGSMGARSPMPGLDHDLRGLPAMQFPPQYLFLKSPLRLSPQCRGHPIDMLIIEDMGDWRR